MRSLGVAFAVLGCVATLGAAPQLDQANEIVSSVGGRTVYAGNSPGQSFTAGLDGLLTQVDVMLRRDAGDIGSLALEVWPMVAGAPAGQSPLYSAPIDPADVPTGSFGYVPVDVSAGGIGVNYGDELTIAVSGSADLSGDNAAWNRGNFDYPAGRRWDRFGAWETDGDTFDYGFRTYVDPDVIPAGLVVLPTGDYNADARVDLRDYTVWRDSAGQTGPGLAADGNRDGVVNDADYAEWTTAFGLGPDEAIADGGFESGGLAAWDVIVDPNTNLQPGFPRVEAFDVTGDGVPSDAMRVRLGRFDTGEPGGLVTLRQRLLLEEGDYAFAADFATQSLDDFSNSGSGNYLLELDGQVIDQAVLNGTFIEAGGVLRGSLAATVPGVTAGYHTVSITVARGATRFADIYHLVDNLRMTRLGSAAAVPEPGCLTLLLAGVGPLVGHRRRRRDV
ncbi:MAG: hypothetical protein AAFV43_09400 [Planctomycetota bacterium]